MERLTRVCAVVLDFATVESVETSYQFKQFDYGANDVHIQVAYDGEIVELDDEVITTVFKDSSGKIVFDTQSQPVKAYGKVVDAKRGLVVIPVPNQVLKKVGEVTSEMMVMPADKTKRLTSPSFSFSVLPSIFDFETPEKEEKSCKI